MVCCRRQLVRAGRHACSRGAQERSPAPPASTLTPLGTTATAGGTRLGSEALGAGGGDGADVSAAAAAVGTAAFRGSEGEERCLEQVRGRANTAPQCPVCAVRDRARSRATAHGICSKAARSPWLVGRSASTRQPDAGTRRLTHAPDPSAPERSTKAVRCERAAVVHARAVPGGCAAPWRECRRMAVCATPSS
eukprot:365318-Chlamydomonas_euryale.AAC.14